MNPISTPAPHRSKTIPSPDEFEWSAARHADRMENWSKPEADTFGTWFDWSDAGINYLLTELFNGFWDDCGDRSRGVFSAGQFCRAALIANESISEVEDPKIPRILDAMARGLDYLVSEQGMTVCECAEGAAPHGLELAKDALFLITGFNAVASAIDSWGRPNPLPLSEQVEDMQRHIAEEQEAFAKAREELAERERRIEHASALVVQAKA